MQYVFIIAGEELCTDSMRLDEIINLVKSDNYSRETIKQLESDLRVYKNAYNGLEVERQKLDLERQNFEQQIQESNKKREDLENLLKVFLSTLASTHLMLSI